MNENSLFAFAFTAVLIELTPGVPTANHIRLVVDENRVMLLRDVGPVQTNLADVHGSFPIASCA